MRNSLLEFLLTVLIWSDFNLHSCEALGAKDIAFVILSQSSSHHENEALRLKNDLLEQTESASAVYLTHEDFPHRGDWTIFPLLPKLWRDVGDKCGWILFCTEKTRISVSKLITTLEEYDEEGEWFVGRALQDSEPTIIHHFASPSNIQYPLFESAFVINRKLLKKLAEKVKDDKIFLGGDFSIDASYELALFIQESGNKTRLAHSSKFCLDSNEECVTYVSRNGACGLAVKINKIFFAVKTCKKFHANRIPVVKGTWGNRARHIAYYSDDSDESIPTVRLNVVNTVHGHCGKTSAIIKDIKNRMDNDKNLNWAVIADDDTIFSIYRIQELLTCYDSKKPIAVGERYGYNLNSDTGYNYITGGGGVVLSKAAVMKFWEHEKSCSCPTNSTPDDMFLLGICLYRLNITLIHVSMFHQARPSDYSREYLRTGEPVSFHKHWMINPHQIYEDWFQKADLLIDKKQHVEL